jgi:hypothetical protein
VAEQQEYRPIRRPAHVVHRHHHRRHHH